jgi:hypothetical protein
MKRLAALGSVMLAATLASSAVWLSDTQADPGLPTRGKHEHRIASRLKVIEDREGSCRYSQPLPSRRTLLRTAVLHDPRVLVRGRVRADTGSLVEPYLCAPSDVEGAVHPDGRFEVLGQHLEPKLEFLRFGANGCAERELSDVAVGTNDLDVVLLRVGTVRARVEVEPQFLEMHDLMRFDLIDHAGLRWGTEVSTEETRWCCRWDVPLRGNYRLEVRPFTAAQPTVEVQNIEVVADDAIRRPLMLDLRGRLQHMYLSVRDATGAPLHSEFYGKVVSLAKLFRDEALDPHTAVGSGHATHRRAWRDATGISNDGCDLLAADNWVTVRVGDETLAGAYAGPCIDTTLTLRSRPQSWARIIGLQPTPDDARWTLRLVAEGGEGAVRLRDFPSNPRRPYLRVADIDEAGCCNLALVPATRYRVSVWFTQDRHSPELPHHALSPEPGTITVGASPPRRLVLRVDPNRVREALR